MNLSSIRGGAKDVIDVPLVQVWLSSLVFFKHFSLDVPNEQTRIVLKFVQTRVNGYKIPFELMET